MFLASGEPESSLIIQDFYCIYFLFIHEILLHLKKFFTTFIKLYLFILVLHFIASFYTFYKLWLIHFHL